MMSSLSGLSAVDAQAGRQAPALPLVVVTTFFPNASAPRRTLFVKNLVQAMRAQSPVLSVLAPLPYAPPVRAVARWKALRGVSAQETIDGIGVGHPRFVAVPGLTWLNGLSYGASLFMRLLALKRAHGPFLVHVHCAYPDGVGAALCARLLGLPYLVTAHGSDLNVYAERASLRWQIRWALRGAAGVMAVSAALRQKVIALIGSADAEARVAHIPCAGFDPAVFTCRSLPPRAVEGGRSIVFVGHLVAIKGLPFLMQAWQQLKASGAATATDRLVIVGDGPERAALERQAAEAGLAGSIVFTGSVPPAEVARHIGSAVLLCLPSLNEGTPNVVVEALASGVPVVASRVGGIPDLVTDGVNGELAPAGDSTALAAALSRVMAREWPPLDIRRSVDHLTWHELARRNIAFLSERTPRRA